MMRTGWYHPTINLDRIAPACPQLGYLVGEGRALDCKYAMSNNFAFGGVNSSLVFRPLD
jgi:3-oxoacyl-[acyl-carrier-protein] synthase II